MQNLYFEKFENKLLEFKNNIFNSKKYWTIYLVLILSYSLFMFISNDYLNINGIFFISLLSFLGIFCISYFHGHNVDDELYKTAFIIILIFGVAFSFVYPILFGLDEVEHFVRAEMTSRGVFFPEYNETPFFYEGTIQRGSYMTIQSTFDLINDFKFTRAIGYDSIPFSRESTIFYTYADTNHINYTLVNYHSAFTQNPFYGYIVPALGILLAKLLNLNAIWLLWLGRIFNTILYAILVALAIKKTPILKVPLLIIACIPLTLIQSSSLSIDSLINGLGILSIAYFFNMCYSKDLTYKHTITFSLIVLLLGLCKLTYFSFILLLIFVPMDNFKEKKYYYFGFISIFVLVIIAILWSKYYANPNYIKSYRFLYFQREHINSTEQLNYIFSHKSNFILSIFVIFAAVFDFLGSWVFNSSLSLFLLLMSLFYPKSNFNFKIRIGALIVVLILYFGTFFVLLLTWTPVGQLFPKGVESRYFYPILGLIPFIFGINHQKFSRFKIDSYLIMFCVTFILFNLIMLVVKLY